MEQLPHTYSASTQGCPEGNLAVGCADFQTISCAPPAQFDGPGDQWSPEELLLSSVSSCLVLSFRAIARASQFEWTDIHCETEGKLDKVERQVKFTELMTRVTLTIADGSDSAKAEKLLHKAEQTCFISNSLNCSHGLSITIE